MENILNAGNHPLPLTPLSLEFLVGTIKELGYKSSYIYLAEAKTVHVEKGHPWTQVERNYKLCMAAAKEAQGRERRQWRLQKQIGLTTDCYKPLRARATKCSCQLTCSRVACTG